MLMTRNAIRNAAKLTTTEDPRYSLNGALVEPDGSTVTTDGHYLYKYTPDNPGSGEEFPNVDGIETTGPALEPFILSRDGAAALLKALPTKQSIPVLNLAALDTKQTNENGQAFFAVSDLETPQIIRTQKLLGKFPNYQAVMPKEEPAATVTLGVGLLKKLLTELSAMKATTVKVETFAEDKPVRLTATVSDGKVEAVLMPRYES